MCLASGNCYCYYVLVLIIIIIYYIYLYIDYRLYLFIYRFMSSVKRSNILRKTEFIGGPAALQLRIITPSHVKTTFFKKLYELPTRQATLDKDPPPPRESLGGMCRPMKKLLL